MARENRAGPEARTAAAPRRAADRAAEPGGERRYSAGMPRADKPLTVLVAGASGLVGRALLRQLLEEDRATVHALLRRDVSDLPSTDRLTRHLVDFTTLGALPRADELYIALGTTIKVAGSKAAFRAVDLDAVVNVARAAHAAGVERCAVVSALGADARSKVFYNQVKGEMERALHELRFERLVIARPSLLAGDRETLGQPSRPGEQIMLALLRPVAGLIPASVRPIDAASVARAMRLALRTDGLSRQVLESGALRQLGQRA
jgi:uncharacterized protein YbjT (DUF2867 family)